ncbi:MAG: hypothetical protein V1837_02675 [Candidatus Woesearchaeota archaeon]
MNKTTVTSDKLLDIFVQHLSSEHHWSKHQIERLIIHEDKSSISIPVTVFSTRLLGSFEALVKFMHENLGLRLSQISKLINRDPRTIWNAYHASQRKMPGPLQPADSTFHLPFDVFSSRKLSVLESIVHFLEPSGLGNSELARLINRDPRTISTVRSRIAVKLKNER